jgi:ubiquinone/menaquinone biosynthesis C-methylase UbiE
MHMAQWRQKRGHMRYYDKTAHGYNALYAEEQRLKIEIALKDLELKAHSAMVDLGCGTGLLLPRAAEKAETVVCLDTSRGMLEAAKSNARLSPGIHLIRADADHTPLRQGLFDAVCAITVLQNMPRPHQTLQEIWRITKPDAQLILTGLKKHFTRQDFTSLLENAGLCVHLLAPDDKAKCHIVTCRKRESMDPGMMRKPL